MNPAWSIVFFTILAGCGQGIAVVLALATLADVPMSPGFVASALATALLLLLAGLAASFLHLGRKLRAWRAVTMWRTSWMSREVIVLPAFIALVTVWWLVVLRGSAHDTLLLLLALATVLLALLLWLCTAMIYACLRFVQEWSHPITVVNFTLIGLATGLVAAGALAAATGNAVFARALAPWALASTITAGLARLLSLRRNAALRPASTLQSATGIDAVHVVQVSMGMTGGSFNTREFFHRASARALARIRLVLLVCGFAAPALLVLVALRTGSTWPWLFAAAMQAVGIVAERWLFFAEAKHPQNLYYQRVG